MGARCAIFELAAFTAFIYFSLGVQQQRNQEENTVLWGLFEVIFKIFQ